MGLCHDYDCIQIDEQMEIRHFQQLRISSLNENLSSYRIYERDLFVKSFKHENLFQTMSDITVINSHVTRTQLLSLKINFHLTFSHSENCLIYFEFNFFSALLLALSESLFFLFFLRSSILFCFLITYARVFVATADRPLSKLS